MKPNRDPDRMVRVWLDLMPDEAPDRSLAAIHQAIETTPQVRRDLVPAMRRFLDMNRSTYAAAAVVVVAVLAGGAFLLRPSSNNGNSATPTPSHAAPASVTPTTSPAVAPAALRTTWLANDTTAGASAASQFMRLVIDPAGTKLSIVQGGASSFTSTPASMPAGELDIMSRDVAGGCQVGDLGRYSFTLGTDGSVPNSDGATLQLRAVSDACAARSSALGRTWFHAIDGASNGGRGISTAFAPMFLITLPAASYAPENGIDVMSLSSNLDRTLYVVKDPVGWTDPCNGGVKLPVAPTIAAFTAYLRTLPGFTVQSTALQIDGHPAVHLIVPSVKTSDCPTDRVYEWSAGADPSSGGWHLNQGETDVLYLVEVDGHLILFQWLGGGVTAEEEQALVATVHFTDTLPS